MNSPVRAMAFMVFKVGIEIGVLVKRGMIHCRTVLLTLLTIPHATGAPAGTKAPEPALPGFHFEFPRDHFSHPSYQTEWWYYTGNLKGEGKDFGFEVTFFRFRPDWKGHDAELNPVWDPSQIYIAHFAVSDLTGRHFYHEERVNRAGPRLAGIDRDQQKIWNGNWSARWLSFRPARQELEAVSDNAHLLLQLVSKKPEIIHGQDGISRKGPLPGQASHYYSLTRMGASGQLKLGDRTYGVTGQAWMDREFFSSVAGDSTTGWDWMCIQLDNNQELMLYQLHMKDGSISPYSSGTFIDESGKTQFLQSGAQFSLAPVKTWHSPTTGGDYPVEWQIAVPSQELSLRLTTPLSNQELVNRMTRSYWEGSVRYDGSESGKHVTGVGYLEMTGYGEKARKQLRSETLQR